MIPQDIKFMPAEEAKSAILAAQEGQYPLWITYLSGKSGKIQKNWKMSSVVFCNGTDRSLDGKKDRLNGADFFRAVWHCGSSLKKITIDIPTIIAIRK